MKKVKLDFVGFGTVGQGCAKHLIRYRSRHRRQYGFHYKVVAIADPIKGSVQNNIHGLDLQRALEMAQQGKKLDSGEAS